MVRNPLAFSVDQMIKLLIEEKVAEQCREKYRESMWGVYRKVKEYNLLLDPQEFKNYMTKMKAHYHLNPEETPLAIAIELLEKMGFPKGRGVPTYLAKALVEVPHIKERWSWNAILGTS